MGNRPTIDRVLSVGRHDQDEPIAQVWATANRHTIEHVDYSTARRRARAGHDFILASFDSGTNEYSLKALLEKGATSVIWLKDEPRNASVAHNAAVAIDYCRTFPNVIDVVGSSLYHSDGLRKRLDNFYRGNMTLYPKMDAFDRLPGDRPIRVFPSTPYYDVVGDPFLNAIGAVFDGPAFEVLNPGSRHGHGQVPELVCKAIEASDLIVINAREGGGHGKYNPNVWQEVGYAQGLNRRMSVCPKCRNPEVCPVCRVALQVPEKRFLFFRHVDDTERELPVDMGRPSWITYEDELDLAMQIHWGKKR